MQPMDSDDDDNGGDEGGVTEHNILVTMEFSNLPRVQVHLISSRNFPRDPSSCMYCAAGAPLRGNLACVCSGLCARLCAIFEMFSEAQGCSIPFCASWECCSQAVRKACPVKSLDLESRFVTCHPMCSQVIDLLMQHGSPDAVMQTLFQ